MPVIAETDNLARQRHQQQIGRLAGCVNDGNGFLRYPFR